MKIIKMQRGREAGVAQICIHVPQRGAGGRGGGGVGVVECRVKPDQYGRKRTTVANPRHINQEKGQNRTDRRTDRRT